MTRNTREAAEALGITQPTFRRRVRLLKLQPEDEGAGKPKRWTDEQIEQIGNPPPKCAECGSPYHDVCYLAQTARRRFPLKGKK